MGRTLPLLAADCPNWRPPVEPDVLQACEHIVSTRRQHFGTVGMALARIRDARLDRAEYPTFEAYCQAKWQLGRSTAHGLIAAARVLTELLGSGNDTLPDHESQVRPLIGLSGQQAKAAWECAVKNAGGQKVTARQVKKAVDELHFSPALSGRYDSGP